MRLLRLEDRINPTQLLPDLQILSSYLSGWTINNLGGNAREMRFSTAMANGGQGAFETRGTPNYITNANGIVRVDVRAKVRSLVPLPFARDLHGEAQGPAERFVAETDR